MGLFHIINRSSTGPSIATESRLEAFDLSKLPADPTIHCLTILGGSWDLVSRVISKVTIVLSTYNLNYDTYTPTY